MPPREAPPGPTPLQQRWTTLYHTTLPSLARSRHPSQPHWPVTLDHCFARIILDNAIGVTRPWTEVVKAPAVRNMTEVQLRKAIELGEAIEKGERWLVELDERSLALRGKGSKVKGGKTGGREEEEAKEEAVEGSGVVEEKAGRKRKGTADGENAVEDGESPKKQKKEASTTKKEKKDTGTISKYFLPKPKACRPSTNSSTLHVETRPRSPPPADRKLELDLTKDEMPPPEVLGALGAPQGEELATQQSESTTALTLSSNPSASPPPSSPPPSSSPPPPLTSSPPKPDSSQSEEEAKISHGLSLIASSTHFTPFRRQVLTLLCLIPRGQWTSYAAIARYITLSRTLHPLPTSKPTNTTTTFTSPTSPTSSTTTSISTKVTKCSARAIGTALRHNPYAPIVPCHRVLAADGSIGGFGGDWGEEGKYAMEKRRLLVSEGVVFDAKGRAAGMAWEGWEL